jgi:probable F420-dependent oxidoreductase
MKFVLGIGLLTDPSHAVPLAVEAEKTGFDALQVGDSLFYPKHSESKYPYYETDRSFLENIPFIEPVVLLSAMAAVTRRLVLYPSVLKLTSRHPILTAKHFSSLAVISNNRILLGAGITPWKEDLTYLGIPWEGRGRRMDECIAILRGLLTGEYFGFEGEFYRFGELKIKPVPTQPLPIIIGGHSEVALRRAARLGDGWTSAGSSWEDLQRMLKQLGELRREYGTQSKPYQIHAGAPDLNHVDTFRRLEEMGVTHGVASAWNVYETPPTLEAKLDAVRRFGGEVIAQYRR